MIIVAGWLGVAPEDRDRYLAGVSSVTAAAREAPGCLDFVQAPDPLDAGRILVYERWASDEELAAFRSSAGPEPEGLPPVTAADVAKYRIASVEAP